MSYSNQQAIWVIFGSGTDPILLILLLFFLLGQCSSKTARLRLRRFKSLWDESWQDCSSSKYASIDGVGFHQLSPMAHSCICSGVY